MAVQYSKVNLSVRASKVELVTELTLKEDPEKI